MTTRIMIFGLAISTVAAACGGDDGAAGDAAIDAPAVPCTGATPFTLIAPPPAELASLNTPTGTETSARLSPDQLTMYLMTEAGMSTSTRASPTAPWPAPTPVVIPGLGTDRLNGPSLTAAGDALYFARSPMSPTDFSLWRAPRSADGTIGTPVELTELDGATTDERNPYILPDESAIYYSVDERIYRAARLPGGGFATGERVTGLEVGPTPHGEVVAVVTPDERTLLLGALTSDIPDVYLFTRATTTDPWSGAIQQTALGRALPGWISPDGCTLYSFGSYALTETQRDIQLSTRAP